MKEGWTIAILSQRDADKIKQALDALAAPVRLLLFTSGDGGPECETCDDARNLFTEVDALSDKVTLEEHQLEGADGMAARFHIDKVPALALTPADGRDTGIRFYGLPVGYEFATFLEDLSDVAKGKTRLSDETRTAIAGLTSPVRIQVFVTPTWPYCPQAVRLAHQMAMENPSLVIGEMVSANEFMDLSRQFNVYGVPKTVVNNGAVEMEGAMPEKMFLKKVLEAV